MVIHLKTPYSIKYKDGDQIGDNITIINFDHRGEGHNYYNCKCSCGKEFIAREKELENKVITSCGHDKIIKLKDDLTGKEFGNLIVLGYSFSNKDNCSYYVCKCKLCGNKTIVRRDALIKGKTNSCGCLSQQTRLNRAIDPNSSSPCKYKHGMSRTRFHRIWLHILDRCKNRNNTEYNIYGGRGITYDPKWEQFEGFMEDMYESYLEHVKEYGESNTSIDRIDVNGNYCKENCRWATNKEQSRNKRDTIRIKLGSNEYCLMDAYNKYGNKTLLYGTVRDRIAEYNIDPIVALSLPLRLNASRGQRQIDMSNIMGNMEFPVKLICGKKTWKYQNELKNLRNTSFWNL